MVWRGFDVVSVPNGTSHPSVAYVIPRVSSRRMPQRFALQVQLDVGEEEQFCAFCGRDSQ